MEYAYLTRNGDREYNEDCLRVEVCGEDACFVLADGLGGHGGGDEASQLVTDFVASLFLEKGVTDNFLSECFEGAQERLLEEQTAQGREEQMKTTMVVLTKKGNSLRWGHIGDSRLYLFNNSRYAMRTLDHSVPQMLVAAGQIREKEIRGHSDRNRLLHVMGVEWDNPEYQISETIEMEKGMSFLLCTDGFWELILEKDIERQLQKASGAEDWMERMEAIVLKNGRKKNKDNYSAIGVML